MDTLRHLSLELGDEWRKLAHQLNVKRVRVQAILRNTTLAGRSIDDAKYVMLLTWMKAAPRGMNKVMFPDSSCGAQVDVCDGYFDKKKLKSEAQRRRNIVL